MCKIEAFCLIDIIYAYQDTYKIFHIPELEVCFELYFLPDIFTRHNVYDAGKWILHYRRLFAQLTAIACLHASPGYRQNIYTP